MTGSNIDIGAFLASIIILLGTEGTELRSIKAAISVGIACLKVGSNASNLGCSKVGLGHKPLHHRFTSCFDLRGSVSSPVAEAFGGILLNFLEVLR